MAKRSRNSGRSGPDYFDAKYLCEFLGTLMLVLVGCGSIALSGFAAPASALQIGAAFGLAVTAVAYSIGLVSGGHINPAVSIAMWSAGRMRGFDAIMYIIYQLVGAFVGAGLLWLILMGKAAPGAVTNLGQNGYGPGFLGAYSLGAAIGVEFVATLIFTLVILGATAVRGGPAITGLIIGLTLIALHLAFINVTLLSVNPARSFGPAMIVQGNALSQLPVFLIVPAVAGWIAGWVSKSKWFG